MDIVGAFGQQAGDAAFGAGGEFVAQADVGEGAADHDFVIAAARAVAVEVGGRDAVVGQVLAGGAVLLDGAGGEMWSVVTESPRTARQRAARMSSTGAGVAVMPSK